RPHFDDARGATGQDCRSFPRHLPELECRAVPDVKLFQFASVITVDYPTVGQHAVYIEHQQFDSDAAFGQCDAEVVGWWGGGVVRIHLLGTEYLVPRTGYLVLSAEYAELPSPSLTPHQLSISRPYLHTTSSRPRLTFGFLRRHQADYIGDVKQ